MYEEDFNMEGYRKPNKEAELTVPENYFEELSEKMMANVANEEADEDFFLQQQTNILFKAQTIALKERNEWNVPVDYFEKNEETILQNTIKEREAKVFTLRRTLIGVAAAACAVGAVLFLLPNKQVQPNTISFDQLLSEVSLDENDFLITLSDDEMNNLFVKQIELANVDSLTTIMMDEVVAEEMVDYNENNSGAIKPVTNDNTLTMESLTEEELMQYLLDEESDILGN